jgi:GT2 family glycosyltransferase
MSPAPDVSVCVPVHRRHGPPNLASLAHALPAALDGLSGELVVVLNGISAADAEAPGDAVLVSFDENRGVAKGWNAAARAATAPVLCIVNDDVVPGPGALRLLHDAAAAPGAGVVGQEGSNWRVSEGEHTGYVATDGLGAGQTLPADAISGFLFAVRREVWEQAGGFDETYTPCGYEEIDFATSVRLRLGLENRVVAGVPHEHEFGISLHRPWARVRHNGRSEFLRSIMRRNRRYFLEKWARADG